MISIQKHMHDQKDMHDQKRTDDQGRTNDKKRTDDHERTQDRLSATATREAYQKLLDGVLKTTADHMPSGRQTSPTKAFPMIWCN